MSMPQINLCSVLVREHFGEVAEKVFVVLQKKGATPVGIIAQLTDLKLKQVKSALVSLIQHGLVRFESPRRGFVAYSAETDVALHRPRFPRYIYSAKLLYADAGELIVEEILLHGQKTMSDVLYSVKDRLNEALQESGQKSMTIYQIRDKFDELVQTQLLQRCPALSATQSEGDGPGDLPQFSEGEDKSQYTIPEVTLHEDGKKRKRSTEGEELPPAKKLKKEKNTSDDGIYWRVNFEKFDRYLRDQLLISAISNKIDVRAGEIYRAILRVSETTSDVQAPTTNPLSSHEIFAAVPKELGLSRGLVDQYLRILVEDKTDVLIKVGESGGGMFQISFQRAFVTLCQAHVESIVQERFGSKSVRIFRLLLMKKRLEQKQIEEFAMVPSKEAKELLYTMFREHFLALTEVPRTPDHAPSRTFYLFSVNLNQVARMLLERCYKTLYNLRVKESQELGESRRLLDKHQRMESIVASLEQSGAEEPQKEEIQDMITPAEKAHVMKVKQRAKKLSQGALQLDDTILVLQMYLHYNTAK